MRLGIKQDAALGKPNAVDAKKHDKKGTVSKNNATAYNPLDYRHDAVTQEGEAEDKLVEKLGLLSVGKISIDLDPSEPQNVHTSARSHYTGAAIVYGNRALAYRTTWQLLSKS